MMTTFCSVFTMIVLICVFETVWKQSRNAKLLSFVVYYKNNRILLFAEKIK